jgi:hypothetical protein
VIAPVVRESWGLTGLNSSVVCREPKHRKMVRQMAFGKGIAVTPMPSPARHRTAANPECGHSQCRLSSNTNLGFAA